MLTLSLAAGTTGIRSRLLKVRFELNLPGSRNHDDGNRI